MTNKIPHDLAIDLVDEASAAIDVLCSVQHQICLDAGWHDKPREDGTLIALMHGELSEMMEAVRRGPMPDDHCPEFTNEEVEAADVLLRLFDYCGRKGLRLGGALHAKFAYNLIREDHKADKRALPGGKKF